MVIITFDEWKTTLLRQGNPQTGLAATGHSHNDN